MKRNLMLLAMLSAAAAAGATAQLMNLTFDTSLDATFGGQTVVSHFEVMTAAGTQAYFAVAIASGGSGAPSSASDWVIDENGTYASSKSAPTNACPMTGYPGPVQGGSAVWITVTASFRMPSYPACTPKKLFVVAYEGPTMDLCSYQAILSQAFTANNSGCATATPSPGPPTATATLTQTPVPGTATPTRTPPPASTATETPAGAPTAQAAASQADPIKVVRAYAVPNPNPSAVYFDLQGAPDTVGISFYTLAYQLIGYVSVPGSPAGWRHAAIPALQNGQYYVKVQAISGGAGVSSAYCVANVQR